MTPPRIDIDVLPLFSVILLSTWSSAHDLVSSSGLHHSIPLASSTQLSPWDPIPRAPPSYPILVCISRCSSCMVSNTASFSFSFHSIPSSGWGGVRFLFLLSGLWFLWSVSFISSGHGGEGFSEVLLPCLAIPCSSSIHPSIYSSSSLIASFYPVSPISYPSLF